MEIIQAEAIALSGYVTVSDHGVQVEIVTARAGLCMSVIFDCQQSWNLSGLTGHADSPNKGVCEVLSWR